MLNVSSVARVQPQKISVGVCLFKYNRADMVKPEMINAAIITQY